MFYRVMKRIYQFAADLLSYIPAKYYSNRSTSDLVIAKSRRVNFFLKHSVYATSNNMKSVHWLLRLIARPGPSVMLLYQMCQEPTHH